MSCLECWRLKKDWEKGCKNSTFTSQKSSGFTCKPVQHEMNACARHPVQLKVCLSCLVAEFAQRPAHLVKILPSKPPIYSASGKEGERERTSASGAAERWEPAIFRAPLPFLLLWFHYTLTKFLLKAPDPFYFILYTKFKCSDSGGDITMVACR